MTQSDTTNRSRKPSFLSSKKFHGLLGMLVSAVLIGWMVVSVDWSGVANELRKLKWSAFIACLLGLMGHFAIRAWRWKYLLPVSDTRPSFAALMDGLMIGNFATYVLPLRAGEFIRPLVLTLHASYGFASAFVSVVIERFFDLACVLLSFAVIVYYITGIPPWVQHGAWVLSALAMMIFLFIIAGALLPHLLLAVLEKILAVLPDRVRSALLKFTSEFLSGTRVLAHGGNLLKVIVLTALVWGSSYALSYIYFLPLDMEPSWPLAVTTGVIVALAVAAPSAPGFIGVYQTACIASFELFGYSRELAVAYSLVSHLFQYIVFIIYAWHYFLRSKLSLSLLVKRSRPTAEQASPS
ncbi:MAG: flippase-like domain-containing protein [Deltaproteobacteria bacterium]|nr:flippase-like domain-containing protein [Deltaproteobacteria bacterium]